MLTSPSLHNPRTPPIKKKAKEEAKPAASAAAAILDPSLLKVRRGRIMPGGPAADADVNPPTAVTPRRAGLADLMQTVSPSGDGPRVHHGGYLRPSVELNSMRPVQLGVRVVSPAQRLEWLMRSHPVIVIREEDLGVRTVGPTTIAEAAVVIAWPYESEYVDLGPIVTTRAFNAINPNAGRDDACAEGAGTIPMTDFVSRGRMIVMPHPTADQTVFRVYARSATGQMVEIFTRFAGSRTLFGAAEVRLDAHMIGGVPYGHSIRSGTGGSGPWSDSDGSGPTVGRRIEQIAPGAGPAIIDVHVRYPMTITSPGGGRLVTTSAWATRLR